VTLHSGVYGGAVANPITILSKMIASLHDENNHITIPGFYDDVLIIATEEERKLMAKAPFDEAEYKTDLGVKELWGEKGFSTNERTGIRPTLELNGIWGGYTGEGAKTVLAFKSICQNFCKAWCLTRNLIKSLNCSSTTFIKLLLLM
jgi:acetylornithine deacetylase/succinyl-diaminopimelate desuccinylase-like protein